MEILRTFPTDTRVIARDRVALILELERDQPRPGADCGNWLCLRTGRPKESGVRCPVAAFLSVTGSAVATAFDPAEVRRRDEGLETGGTECP
ncbi:hypothetical protein MRX96_058437 [Rhipicephalus microplus]